MEHGRAGADVLDRDVLARPGARHLRDAERDRGLVIAHSGYDANGVRERVQIESHDMSKVALGAGAGDES
jgi:hypothetical protein